jgi:hypothetical protein
MVVLISLLFIYLSTYYSIVGACMVFYVGIIGFFYQSIKIIPQNPQTFCVVDLDMFLLVSHPSFIDTNGCSIIVSSGSCA